MLDRMDPVWEHGTTYIPVSRYCKKKWKGRCYTFQVTPCIAWGDVQGCRNVPLDFADFFRREINKVHDKKKARAMEEARRLALVGSHRGSDDDAELQVAMCASREEEEELRRHARASGGTYETCGGSSQGVVHVAFGRTPSKKEKPQTVQTRIDTGPFSKAGKNVVHFVGQQWAKWIYA